MQKLILTFALLGIAYVTHAQTRFSIGPVGAYTLSTGNFKSNDSYTGYTTGYHSDFAAGVLAEVSFGHVLLQPSLQFARKGFSQQSSGTASPYLTGLAREGDTRLDYLTLPVNLAYALQADGQGFRVLAGPYLGVLTGGHFRYDLTYDYGGGTIVHEANEGSVKPTDSYQGVSNPIANTYYMRRLDMGLQGGVGYRHHGLVVQAAYSVGLLNAAARNTSTASQVLVTQPDSYHNMGFQFSLAYLFGGNPS